MSVKYKPRDYIQKRYHAEILFLGEKDGKRHYLILTNKPIDVEEVQKRFGKRYKLHIEEIDLKNEETLAQLKVLAEYLAQQGDKK